MTPTSSPCHHLFSSLVAALIAWRIVMAGRCCTAKTDAQGLLAVTRLLSGNIVIFSETSCCTKGFQENVFL
ncbi:Os03g0793450 [Oryza sativa Japonica Group]|uniref:Os03g0793450 protein n=1 Tax=Oryza sativa subsp. japonica TaxID=39947 RepID=A0A0P0W4M6_ORYSJ|nr:hypothetical protein EE612_020955 [Oryza sativa]BAS86806.1 Os03g0793450 [Oryza sativa Japonica Group]